MKTILTKSLTTLILLCMPLWIISLRAQTDEQIERFKQEMESYYNEQLALTPSEQGKFWPIYNDFYNRKLRLDEDERNMYRYCHSNVQNMTDQEITQALEKIMQVKDDKHGLQKEFHEKFMRILPPKKVLLLYKVERDFRMHLIRQLRKRGEGNEGRRGGGSNMGPGPGTDMGNDRAPAPGMGQLPGADRGNDRAPAPGWMYDPLTEPCPGHPCPAATTGA